MFRRPVDRTRKGRRPTLKTYSLIFDTEQLGCVRYGIPRLGKVLNANQIHGTFFITGFVKWVYPHILESIRAFGEVGIHGLYHEPLNGLSTDAQIELIRQMVRYIGGEVRGANFLGRMDEETLTAMIRCGIDYYVSDAVVKFGIGGFEVHDPLPRAHMLLNRTIWEFPVSVETYSYPWLAIKNRIEAVELCLQDSLYKHMTILCHPFRDGNLANIQTVSRIVRLRSTPFVA